MDGTYSHIGFIHKITINANDIFVVPCFSVECIVISICGDLAVLILVVCIFELANDWTFIQLLLLVVCLFLWIYVLNC